MVKKYNLFKTAKKTARENGLVVKEPKHLYDLSILDELKLDDTDRHILEIEVIRYHWWTDRQDSFYVDNTPVYYSGRTKWAIHKVYDKKTYNLLYNIIQLTDIKVIKWAHDSWNGTDKTIYEDTIRSGYIESGIDIEL